METMGGSFCCLQPESCLQGREGNTFRAEKKICCKFHVCEYRKDEKMKKRIVRYKRKRVYNLSERFIAVAAALTLAVLVPVNARAEEAAGEVDVDKIPETPENQVIHYVYHSHAGSSDVEGGCYQGAIYHTHQGNEEDGGPCYGKPIYHAHQGSEAEGGPCYQTPICHEHSGNPQEGSGCFVPVYHSHSGGCYRTVTSSEYGCSTVRWWDTSDGDYEGHDFKYYEMSCGTTVHGTNSSHNHTVTVCNRGGSIERYTLGCGKTEETPESYVFDCEKKPGLTIDSYEFNCEKTTDTIDGYQLACGMDEQTRVGKIVLTEKPMEDRKKASVKAAFEDLTGGKLVLSENPFCWKDKSGNLISNDLEAVVDKNGDYGFQVDVTNEDVRKEDLSAAISVSSIYVPASGGGNGDGGTGSGNDGDGSHGGNGNGGSDGDGNDQGAGTSPSASPSAVPSPSVTPIPSAAPETKGHGSNGKGSGSAETEDDSSIRSWWQKENEETEIPGILAETETVMLPEIAANREIETGEITGRENNGNETIIEKILSAGAVKVVGITFGALLILTGLSALIYFLCMSVRVYNDQGQGKWKYLGRYAVKLDEDGYRLTITESVVERSVSNRYRIRPDLFGLFKKEEELLVRKEERTVSAQIRKEMIITV